MQQKVIQQALHGVGKYQSTYFGKKNSLHELMIWYVVCLKISIIIIDCEAKEIMYLVASVHLPVRPFVCLFVRLCVLSAVWSKEESLPVKSISLCVCNQWAYADNCADAVDRLLIFFSIDRHDCVER